jgi:hypothetical protein
VSTGRYIVQDAEIEERVLDTLEELIGNEDYHGQEVARYAYRKNGTIMSRTGPCHSALNHGDVVDVLATSPNITAWRDVDKWGAGRHDQCIMGSAGSMKKFRAWWEYLVHDSPWESCFLTKELTEKGVLMDCSQPANWVMAAIIATRHPHEYPQRVLVWYDAVQAGGDPLALMALVENINVVGTKQRRIEMCGGGDIHDMFDMYGWGKVVFSNFMHAKPVYLMKSFDDGGRFDGIHKLFGNTADNHGNSGGFPVGKLNWLGKQFNHGVFKKDLRITTKVYSFPDGYTSKRIRATSYALGIQTLAELSQSLKEQVHA